MRAPSSGTAGRTRTSGLDLRRVALCVLLSYSRSVWLSETVSNRQPPLCKSGALPAELSDNRVWPAFIQFGHGQVAENNVPMFGVNARTRTENVWGHSPGLCR